MNGPVSLDKNPCRSYLEAVKFRALEEKEMGHHSAQHTLSLSCFQYGAMPSPSHVKKMNLPFTQDIVTEASLGLENQLNAHHHGIRLPRWLRGKESAPRCRRRRFDP